jgi:hypothetical protein
MEGRPVAGPFFVFRLTGLLKAAPTCASRIDVNWTTRF